MKLDAYTIKARLLPFIQLIAPVVLLLTTIFTIPFSLFSSIPVLLELCITLITTIFVRNRGESIEPKLWASWGGPPTTRFLRYNNNEFNSIEKKLCHEYFRRNLPEVQFPSEQYEAENPQSADEIYGACITYLRTQSRNMKKYPLVHAENINYGFLRNSLGIKPFGIVLSLLTLAVTIIIMFGSWVCSHNFNTQLLVPATISIVAFVCWVFFISEKAVKASSEKYARRLLEICLEKGYFTEQPTPRKAGL